MSPQLTCQCCVTCDSPGLSRGERGRKTLQLPESTPTGWVCSLYCTVTNCNVLNCTILYCNVLNCTLLNCTILCCTELHCTALSSTALYCTVLYCGQWTQWALGPEQEGGDREGSRESCTCRYCKGAGGEGVSKNRGRKAPFFFFSLLVQCYLNWVQISQYA